MVSPRNFAAGAAVLSVAAARQCQNITVPVTLSAQNADLGIPVPTTNIAVTDLILDALMSFRQTPPAPPPPATEVSGSYELAATYCEPDTGASNVLQVLTAGIGFDRTYWDFPINNYNYSYVNFALDQGYSTLAWDRLGLGESSHGDPVTEIQGGLSVAALHELTRQLREGSVADLDATFEKIVHVGHSLGSAYTYAMTAADPSISDGIVLTGFSQTPDFTAWGLVGLHLVNANTVASTAHGSEYADGYLGQGDEVAVQTVFFAPGMFDPDVLHATFLAGQPLSAGEFATLAGLTLASNNIAGPVLIATGQRDIIYCGTDCNATGDDNVESLLDLAESSFPMTRNFTTETVPNAGHGLNLDFSSLMTYNVIADFFAQNGLSP